MESLQRIGYINYQKMIKKIGKLILFGKEKLKRKLHVRKLKKEIDKDKNKDHNVNQQIKKVGKQNLHSTKKIR